MAESRYKLVACEIYRDGGSLGAVLSHSNKPVSLFLEIGPWDHPNDPKTYRSLWVSDGEIPDAHGVELQPSSASEKQWLARCTNVRHANDLDEHSVQLFEAFVDALTQRNR